jgi:Xaa-Pro aminopeptidase
MFMVKLFINKREYKQRIEKIRENLVERGLDALYLTNHNRIFYSTGYHYVATRPQGCLIPVEGDLMFFIPRMEEQRLRERWPWLAKDLVIYFEYPVKNRPNECMELLVEAFHERRLEDKVIGVDGPVLSSVPDFQPPSLQDHLSGAEIVYAGDIVDDMRLIKSDVEIALIEEAAKWCNLAHALLHEYIEPRVSELEISSKASYKATEIMLKTLGTEYEPYGLMWTTARARFKAGRRTAYPHGYLMNRKIKEGDLIETSGSARVGGYNNHMERTMILGEPTDRQRKYFDLMLKTQDAAFDALKPGAKASDVHIAVRRKIKEEGFDPDILMLHRTGRGLGLDGYEPPTLIDGDDTVLQLNMVFHVEPAIYLPDCCFRHCDTVIVTEEGSRDLDYYPRDLEYLTIPTK